MVSTTLGCEGVDVEHEQHLLIADTVESFTAAVTSLFEDPAHGEALGRAGRQKMVAGYSWDYAAELLGSLYEEVLGSRLPQADGPRAQAAEPLEVPSSGR